MPTLPTYSTCVGMLFCGIFIANQLQVAPLSCSKIFKQQLYIGDLKPYKTDKLLNTNFDTISIKNDFSNLGNYLGRNCSYPINARQAHLTGRVIISFEINDKLEITDAKIIEDANSTTAFASEVLNRIKKFKQTVKAKPGGYTYQVLFRFSGEDRSADKSLDYKKPAGTVLIFAM
jgi:TonB family protein